MLIIETGTLDVHSQSDLLILFGPHPDLYCIQRKLGFIQLIRSKRTVASNRVWQQNDRWRDYRP